MKLAVWIFGCPHEVKDTRKGYRSLHTAIQDSLNSFSWDIALDLGDHDASAHPPLDASGQVVIDEFASLSPSQRAAVYSVCGNHDRSGPLEAPAWWWRKYIDPLGENTATSGVDSSLRPYPIEGTWERYKFEVGNIVFLMMSDVNRPITAGRGVYGGDPGGVISQETWGWWCREVEANRDKIIISCHHYLIRETTIATGDWEGVRWDSDASRWTSWIHGNGRNPKHSSRLSYIGEIEGAPHFENYFSGKPGCVALWFGAHNHLKPGQTINGRGFIERKWNCTFVQASALTAHHGVKGQLYPRSYLLTIEDGEQNATIQTFFHTNSDLATKGFASENRKIDLGKRAHVGAKVVA